MKPLKPYIAIPLFLLGAVLIDRALGLALDKAFERAHYGQRSGGIIQWSLAQSDAELFIFGSSRAKHHLDPEILGDELDMRAVNLGVNGQEIHYSLMLEILLLERTDTARVFVLQVDPKELYNPEPRRALIFAPYYGRNRRVDEILHLTSKHARLKLQSKVYRYNGKLLAIVQDILRPGHDKPGFYTLPGKLDHFPTPRGPGVLLERDGMPGIHQGVVELFAEFIRRARDKGVKVVLVVGPRLRPKTPGKGSRYRAAMDEFRRIARAGGGVFLELSEATNPEFRNPALFRDWSHLNARGAALFSRQVARAIHARVSPSGK